MLMQRIKAAFLLVVILLQCAGVHIWAGWQLNRHHAAMRKACKAIQPRLSFSAAELKNARWIHEEEFVLNGKLYDVTGLEKTASGLRYMVIADSHEDRLRAQQEILHRQEQDKQPGQKLILKKVLDQTVLPEAWQVLTAHETGKTLFISPGQTAQSFRLVPPDPPPPRVQCSWSV